MRLLLALGLAAPLATAAQARPVVLELFTSQSCSSCPPADALLATLADTAPDILPLDFHVDYWNYLSWKDKFSSPAATARQRAYAASLGSEVYTPQLVIHGRYQEVGSRADAIAPLIERARADAATGPALTLTASGTALSIAIGPGTGHAQVLLVGFDREHTTNVAAGENAGRTLREVNVVRDFRVIGQWSGAAQQVTAAPLAGQRSAVLLQAEDGRILAAAAL